MTDSPDRTAELLRAAIESAKAEGVDLPWLQRFPSKACNFTSNLLLILLHDQGVTGLRRMMGNVLDEKGEEIARHVWVTAGSKHIDITADVYHKPAVIVTSDSPWHESLDDVKPFIARVDVPKGVSKAELDRLRELYEDAIDKLTPYLDAAV